FRMAGRAPAAYVRRDGAAIRGSGHGRLHGREIDMDGDVFDRLTAAILGRGNRRAALRLLLGAAGGAAVPAWSGIDARKKKKKKPCPPGTTRCGKHCVDTTSDRKHCNGCGNKCGGSGDVECCFGQCVDVGQDATNCGACNNICDQGQECVQRQCVDACKPNEVRCLLTCRDLQTDPTNCGQCDHECGHGFYRCEGGRCVCDGEICKNKACCPAGYICIGKGEACCPSGMYSCGDKAPGRCCPVGMTCRGSCGDPCCNP
ncbi:MAG TPA: hypothetical protein VFI22_03290, partial [Thermomicrobiales bacterium]|nr:hypothetical protein [Thermomicrobiales bacterium]